MSDYELSRSVGESLLASTEIQLSIAEEQLTDLREKSRGQEGIEVVARIIKTQEDYVGQLKQQVDILKRDQEKFYRPR